MLINDNLFSDTDKTIEDASIENPSEIYWAARV